MKPVVLDCDPGHDDAFAILLAAAHPAIRLLAISTVVGNQTLAKTTLNARRVCTLAGITDVPIVAGQAKPLVGPVELAADVHGESGLDGPRFGPPSVPVTSTDGVGYLRELLRGSAEPVTVVAVGPLTNIAALLLSTPDIGRHIAEIVIMGGSTERGNSTPYAEFNIYADPEAAAVVFGSGLPLVMCGLNVTHQALAGPQVRRRIAGVGGPLAGACLELLDFFGDTYQRLWGFPAPPVHDPVAVARVIDPSIVGCVPSRVDVELAGTHTRGATSVDLHRRTGREPNALVGTELDADRFWALMVDAIAALTERGRAG